MKAVLKSLLMLGAVLGSVIGLMILNYLAAPAFFEQRNQPFTNMSMVQIPILNTAFNAERMNQATGMLYVEFVIATLFFVIYATRTIEENKLKRSRHGE